jgi:outer membrane protein OmpA-like peptidoglycan-associated protein
MRVRWTTILLLAALGGCSWFSASQTFSIYFQPYSAELDQSAQETIHAAADFARAHPLQPVSVNGYSAPPDPKLDVEGLSAKRADAVKQVLISDGVGPGRITIEANGITDPKTFPTVAVRRVDINVGH